MVQRREDGYHDIESIFLPVPICDRLEILPSNTFMFTQNGLALDSDIDNNMVVKAYHLLQNQFGKKIPQCNISLTKNIPFGAGLGGGSSDAAYTLRMLNELFALGMDNDELRKFARLLGADCPFFIDNKPAYVTGIGDKLEVLGFNPVEDFRLIVVKPITAVNTAEAYRGIVPRNQRKMTTTYDLREAIRQPIEQWHQSIVNDFEATVFAVHPELADIKRQLYDAGALYASMSGSGSAIFALFPSDIMPQLNEYLKHLVIIL